MYIVVAMIATVIGAAMVTAWVREIIGTCIIISPRSIFRTS